jgi:predicted component of type VI protein secretion system
LKRICDKAEARMRAEAAKPKAERMGFFREKTARRVQFGPKESVLFPVKEVRSQR